uniref:hypothetical protein n=1 Tax=Thomasclavelia spiroformis TaxID=29348 RepID=UPI00359C839B
MDPQQELFTILKLKLEELGYDVYDGFLPPKNTPYPFIYLADSHLIDDANKSAVFGNVYQTVHIWHNNSKQRGTVSKMLLDIKNTARKIDKTDNFSWFIIDVEQSILADTITSTPLMHGVLELKFKFS